MSLRHVVLTDETDNEAVTELYRATISKLHISLPYVNDQLINSIILQAASKFKFDDIEYAGAVHNPRLSPQEKLLILTNLVDNRIYLDPNSAKEFINFFLNLDGLASISEVITKIVEEKFSERLSIVRANATAEEPVDEYPINDTEETGSDPKQRILPTQSTDDSDQNFTSSTYENSTISGLLLGLQMTMSVFIIFGIVILVVLWTGYPSAVYSKSEPEDIISTSPFTTTSTFPSVDVIKFTSKDFSSSFVADNIFSPSKIVTQANIENTDTFVESTALASEKNIQLRSLPEYKVKTKTYQEYLGFMSNIPPEHQVTMSIQIQSPLDWPNIGYTLLPNSTEITKLILGGLLAVDNIIDILSQCANIEYLYLINIDDKLCQRNNGQLNLVKQINTRAYLPSLRYLIFRDFTRCTEIYETFALYFEPLVSLKRLTLYRSLIDDHNHIFLEEFLRFQGKYIKELVIAEMTVLTTKPLLEASPKMLLMRNVEKIRLDSNLSLITENEIRIGRNFPKTFPNLRVFFSKHGYIKWNKFSNLVRCKKFHELSVGIEVPKNRTYFNVSFLDKLLPFLTKAAINLTFMTCKTPKFNQLGKNEIIGWENIRKPLALIVIRSNCKIYANTVYASRNDTEEKYDVVMCSLTKSLKIRIINNINILRKCGS